MKNKNRNKLILKLRDFYGHEHPVMIYEGAEVDIDIYGGNMVMNKPRKYDTNKIDESKCFRYEGGMEFTATRERVAKFNAYTDSYDCQEFIHQEWMAENNKTGDFYVEVKTGGLLDLIRDGGLDELANKTLVRKEEAGDEKDL